MTKTNKIIKYGLQGEVNSLLNNGVSTYKIAEIIKNDHQDEPGLKSCSHMVVQRYKEIKEKNKLQEVSENPEKDLSEVIINDFRKANQEIINDIKRWSKKAEELYAEAEEDGSYNDRAKILKEVRDGLAQQLRAWESKVQYGARQIRHAGDINQKKIQNLNIVLVDIANDLCDDCKLKALKKLSEIASEQT